MTFHYCPPRRQTRTMTMLHHHIFTYTQKHSLFHSITAFLCALTVPKLLLTVWNKFLVNLITVFVDFQHIIWGLFQWKSIYRDISMGRRVTFRCWIWRWLRFNIFKRERKKKLISMRHMLMMKSYAMIDESKSV